MKSASRMLTIQRGGKVIASRFSQTALLAGKTSNRAAVHGFKEPVTHTLDQREKVEKEIEEGKEEKGEKRQKVNQTADSQLNDPEISPTITNSPGYAPSS